MKIIDLLNKIVNGEEVPKRIKYLSKYYVWFEGYSGNTGYCEEPLKADCNTFLEINTLDLSYEVEVIEEEPRDIEVCGSLFTKSEYDMLAELNKDKKIEKLNEYIHTGSLNYKMCNIMFERITDKINEIIDILNKKEKHNYSMDDQVDY